MNRIEMIKRLPPNSIGYEIGVLEGWFSREILETPVKKLILVDAWEFQEEGYTDPANIEQTGQNHRYNHVCNKFKNDKRVEIIRAWSTSDIVKESLIYNKPDWVYIDANHTYDAVLNDINFFSKYCSHLFLHDYVDNEKSRSMNFGVIKAVTDFLEDNKEWYIVDISDEEWPTVELKRNDT